MKTINYKRILRANERKQYETQSHGSIYQLDIKKLINYFIENNDNPLVILVSNEPIVEKSSYSPNYFQWYNAKTPTNEYNGSFHRENLLFIIADAVDQRLLIAIDNTCTGENNFYIQARNIWL